ncbi:hypothetical protein ACNHKD_03460 [Methylocystis sp. JAN1]|uniref:hypothetical protein n=1 Tax=Methylocystis sp. JAN1 TaxID=3397211 RepID=UPI003FA1E964
MRAYILASCVTALFAFPAAMAAPSDPAPEAQIHQINHRDNYRGRWGYGPDCRELRRACLNKEELGEEGRGNCRRYREICR